jgi:hypothetical protein
LSAGSLGAKALDIYVPLCFSCLVQWQPLVEFTVLSNYREFEAPEGGVGEEDYHHRQILLHIDSIFIQVNNDWLETGDEIVVLSHITEPLEVGQKYMSFLNPTMLDGRIIAIINDDRTITPYQETGGYLQDYNGYMVEQFVDVVNDMLIADIHNCSGISTGDVFGSVGTPIIIDDILVGGIDDFEFAITPALDNQVIDNMIIGDIQGDNSIRIGVDMLIGIIVFIVCINALIILIVINRLKHRYVNKHKSGDDSGL